MTFRPTSKRPGIWPGASGGYEAGQLAAEMARRPDAAAGGRANSQANGSHPIAMFKRRSSKAFGAPNGTISGLSRTADQRITEQFKQQHAIHVRGLARGKR